MTRGKKRISEKTKEKTAETAGKDRLALNRRIEVQGHRATQ